MTTATAAQRVVTFYDDDNVTAWYGSVDAEHPNPHRGTDYAPAGWGGKGVPSATVGEVFAVFYDSLYGNVVGVLVGFDYYWYCHLATALVSVGDWVGYGDIIGNEGSTGDSTGNHLHFMRTADGDIHSRAINPNPTITMAVGICSNVVANGGDAIPLNNKEQDMKIVRNPLNGDCFMVGPKRIQHLGTSGDLAAGKETLPYYGGLSDPGFRVSLIGYSIPYNKAVPGINWDGNV